MKKTLSLLFALCCSLPICNAKHPHLKSTAMFGLFKKTDPIQKFWTWFAANEKRLRNFQKDPDRYLNEVLSQAKKIKSGLAIEFEPPHDGIINMTVSADGDRNLFSTVKNIVDKAPRIPGWKIFAFRQRMNIEKIKGMTLNVSGHELQLSKMKFFPVVQNDSLSLIIYLHGVTEENYLQISYAGLLLMDNVLGEFDCVTKVQQYDFKEMPVNKEELESLLPLLDLPAYVDKFYAGAKQ